MNFNRQTIVIVAILVALAAGAAYWFVSNRAGPPQVAQTPLLQASPLGEMAIGSDDAVVTIIEYASMTCPHCAAFHTATLPELKTRYIDTGKVRLLFREFPFDQRSVAAFMLARCAPKERFFPFVDVLFAQQQVWARAENAEQALLKIALLGGFTQASFYECLKNQEILDSVVGVRNHAQKELGVASTPTFFVNGVKHEGNKSIEELAAIIDPLL